MSYLTIARISGDPDTLVDGYRQSSATMTDVGRDHNLILHVAAPTDDGLLIVNLCRVLSAPGPRAPLSDQRPCPRAPTPCLTRARSRVHS